MAMRVERHAYWKRQQADYCNGFSFKRGCRGEIRDSYSNNRHFENHYNYYYYNDQCEFDCWHLAARAEAEAEAEAQAQEKKKREIERRNFGLKDTSDFVKYYDSIKNVKQFASKHSPRLKDITLECARMMYGSEMEGFVKDLLRRTEGWKINYFVGRVTDEEKGISTRADGICRLDSKCTLNGRRLVDPNRDYLLEIKVGTRNRLPDFPTENHMKQALIHLEIYSKCNYDTDLIQVHFNTLYMVVWLIADCRAERNKWLEDSLNNNDAMNFGKKIGFSRVIRVATWPVKTLLDSKIKDYG